MVRKEESSGFKAPAENRLDFWVAIRQFYQRSIHCDLELCCSDGGSILCHRLILASVSPLLASALVQSHSDDPSFSVACLPDLSSSAVRPLIDAIYSFLAREEWAEQVLFSTEMNSEVCQMLGVNLNLGRVEEGNFSQPNIKKEREEDVARPLRRSNRPNAGKKRKRYVSNEDNIPMEALEDNGDIHWGEGSEERPEPPPKSSLLGKRAKTSTKTCATLGRTDSKKSDQAVMSMSEKQKLSDQLRQCSGSISVSFSSRPLNVLEDCSANSLRKVYFQAFLGLVANKDEENRQFIEGVPLAWSVLDESDVSEQYLRACRAIRSVLGLSKIETYCSPLVYSRQGMNRGNKSHKVRYALKKTYSVMTREELEAAAAREDLANIAQTSKSKDYKNFFGGKEVKEVNVNLNDRLDVDNGLDGLALLQFLGSGSVRAFFLDVRNDKRSDDAYDVMRSLFDVWTVERKKLLVRMPASKAPVEMHKQMMERAETYKIIQEFLNDKDGRERSKIITKEKQCHECGIIFYMKGMNDEFRFVAHRKAHFYKNHRCDCDIEFKNFAAKRAHVQLFHSEGRFVKCEQCDFVARPSAVTDHVEREHAEHTCEGCDQKFVGMKALREHRRTAHPELAAKLKRQLAPRKVNTDGIRYPVSEVGPFLCQPCNKTFEKRGAYLHHMHYCHKAYTCDICGQVIEGHCKMRTHKRNAHPETQLTEEHPCSSCGKVYGSKLKLRDHILRIHTPDKDRPYQCQECDRGFARNLELSAHRMQAHIKTRPYACRYGCGVAYNDYASRGTHERKKHGATFPTAVNTISMQQEQQQQELQAVVVTTTS